MIEGEYCCYLLYRRKGPGGTGGDRRGVLLLFFVSKEGVGFEPEGSKRSIVVIYCIRGRDRVEPEVIEGKY